MISFGSISTNTFSPSPQEPSNTSAETSAKGRLDPEKSEDNETTKAKSTSDTSSATQDLTSEELRELTELKQRDQEVRAHEQAHIAAGGTYVRSGAKFEYEEGPDGKKYAVGGEVSIDTSKVAGDPEATLRKMQAIRSSALAPASPSSQDRKIASQATQKENQARMEILMLRYEEAAALQVDTGETESSDTDIIGQQIQRPSVSLGGLVDITQ